MKIQSKLNELSHAHWPKPEISYRPSWGKLIYNKIMNAKKQNIKFELVFLVDCDVDAEMACGEGAVNCTIQANNNVRCECDTGYHSSDDLHSCVIGKYTELC